MSLRVRPTVPDAEGRILAITPESAGWKYVGFEVRRLAAGQQAALTSAPRYSATTGSPLRTVTSARDWRPAA